MSLITRCPACGTMFKVVPDQLRISEGWVRCGHCSDVFDARAHLQDEGTPEPTGHTAETVSAVTAALQPEAAPVAIATSSREDEASSESFPESEGFASSINTQIDDVLPSQGPDSEQLAEEAQALKEHPLDRPFELRREDVSDSELQPDNQAEHKAHAFVPKRLQPRPAPKAPLAEAPDDEDAELQDLGFVRDARRKAFWDRRAVRGMLLMGGIFLALLLALQIAVHDRDRLFAAHPSLRPWLSAVCRQLDCTIRPPRQIEAISIDSSSFNKVRADSYRLSFTLKNQAPMEVAMPALELTLTDAQDQPVVRRVLMPAEMGAHQDVVAPASEWSASLALAVAPDANGARIAGYRLLAFYP